MTIRNPHPWNVSIDVTGAERDGWVGVGFVKRDGEGNFDAVIDQGDPWIFRFSYSAEQVEVRIPRRELEDNRWSVTVPAEFAERLRAASVPESVG